MKLYTLYLKRTKQLFFNFDIGLHNENHNEFLTYHLFMEI